MYAIADTHAVIWYLLADPRLSETARKTFMLAADSANPIGITSSSIVEMIYPAEKKRILGEALDKLERELPTQRSVLVVVPLDDTFALSVREINRSAVPELPDRIIAATARALDLPLITRDEKIRASTIKTIW